MTQHYDLITIGGGSGGVSASRRASSHGAKVALIEKDRFGGTCVNRGCIPKKLLMYASQFRNTFDIARAFGWSVGATEFAMHDWQDAKTAEIDRLDSVYRSMLEDAKVDIFQGVAEILGPQRIRIGDREITGDRLLIATGGRPAHAPVPGLETALTSDDILNLRAVPKRLAIIGAGYIGIEFASIFARLGSNVSVFFRHDYPLKNFDQDLRIRLHQALAKAGVQFFAQTQTESISRTEAGYLLRIPGGKEIPFDAILNATGRIPNTDNLGLENIALELSAAKTIPVNSYSETSVPGVYAVGDVTNRKKLTPVAIQKDGPLPIPYLVGWIFLFMMIG